MNPSEPWGEMECANGDVDTGEIVLRDGARLFYRLWRPDSQDRVVLIHGLGGHGGWYTDFANALAARGLGVLIADLRGHGQSEGARGHVRRGSVLLKDTAEIVDFARSGVKRIHLLGHSMGAVLAVHASAQIAPHTLILINPWVKDTLKVSPLTVLSIASAGLMGSSRPWSSGGSPERMTDNPDARAILLRDALWGREQSCAFLTGVFWLRILLFRTARHVVCPTIVIQTEQDRLVDHESSRRLYESLGCAERAWSAPATGWHDFQFAADRAAFDDEVAAWCLTRSSPLRLAEPIAAR